MARFRSLLGLAFCSLVFVPRASLGCLHYIGEEDPFADPTPIPYAQSLQQHEGRNIWEQRAIDNRKIADKLWDFRTQNNLTVSLAHLGRLDEALERMQTVERTYLGQPSTAYNLGTVYELKGDNVDARRWTAEGVKRDLTTTGHGPLDGTEWLHLRILDAKVAAKADPEWLNDHSVAGLDFGTGKLPTEPPSLPPGDDGATLTLANVQNSLREQLHERLEFVQAPDAIVGDLLFDLANTLTLQGNEDDARDVYQLALTYKAPQNSLAWRRFNYVAGTPNYAFGTAVWILFFCAVGGYFGFKKWKELQEWKAMPVQHVDEVAPAKRTAFIDFSGFDPYGKDEPRT